MYFSIYFLAAIFFFTGCADFMGSYSSSSIIMEFRLMVTGAAALDPDVHALMVKLRGQSTNGTRGCVVAAYEIPAIPRCHPSSSDHGSGLR